MFDNYPKERINLDERYLEIYAEHYRKNREGATTATSISRKMEMWLHRKVASDLEPGRQRSTLEIGAGTLNQLDYEDTSPYDIIEPFGELYTDSPHLKKIRHFYRDIDEINPLNRYKRITSVATFEHILDLPKVIAKTCLLLDDGGSLRISIPNEGTILWKLGYKLTTGIEFRLKYGLNYSHLMRYEHVNTAGEIEQVLKYFYTELTSAFFGLSKQLAFYRFFECRNPDKERAGEYLMQMLNNRRLIRDQTSP